MVALTTRFVSESEIAVAAEVVAVAFGSEPAVVVEAFRDDPSELLDLCNMVIHRALPTEQLLLEALRAAEQNDGE